MDIKSLHKSILLLTDDELYAKIRHLRSLRRMTIEKVKKTLKKTENKKKSKLNEDQVLQNIQHMSKDEKSEFIKNLIHIKEHRK